MFKIMPVYHNNILCVTETELRKCGVTATYLKRARAGQRKGEVFCWEHHKVGKTTYYHYHSLREGYQNMIKVLFCEGVEPEIYAKEKEAQKAKNLISNLADQITSLVHTDPMELEELMSTQLFTPTEAHQLARAAGWLRLINEFDVKKARKLGFQSIEDLRNEIFKRCLNEQNTEPIPLIRFKKKTITSQRVLLRNAAHYKTEGIRCLIHAGVGNVNREKADHVSHAKLIELASAQVKYSWEDIGLMYNDWAQQHGKEQLTVSAIKQRLNTPKVKRVWFYARHGKLAGDNELQQFINRDKPSFPDALWSIDGTTMQLYYRDEKGEIRSDLYAYFVTDANTGAIIGYSIAYTETSELVESALRMAVTTHGYKPYQLQYDNSSANVSATVKNLMTSMSRVHFPCEPYKGRSKYVEGIIGHFQQRVLHKFENFKGSNVTSKSLNGKANPELLAKFKGDPQLLPSIDGVLQEFDQAVGEWNKRGEKRDKYGRFVGESKITKYTTIQHEKRARLNYFDIISLFLIEQKDTYSYGNNGIVIERNGAKRHYIVPDPDKVGDFIFAADNFGQKFKVRIDRERPELITLYQNGKYVATAYEKERYASAVADLKDGEKAKLVLLKNKQEEFGQKYSILELERQMAILGEGELKATGTEGFGWWDTSKTNENKRESVLEDAANGMGDGLTDRQRKILNIGK